jgi:hypothetical protein
MKENEIKFNKEIVNLKKALNKAERDLNQSVTEAANLKNVCNQMAE